MRQDTNISIIQLIKKGDISINLEIENLNSSKDINIYVRQYLDRSSDYIELKEKIRQAQIEMRQAKMGEKEFFVQKVEHLYQIEKDFITNALLLAKLFSEINVRTETLKQAMQLFEKGKIKEADSVLKADDLLNDQFNLLVFIEYREARLKLLGNE